MTENRKEGKRARRSRAEWAEEVARWQASGQSAEQYAAEHDLHPQTLSWWALQLKKWKQAPAKSGHRAKKFLPVIVRDSAQAAESTGSMVEVFLTNGRRVRVATSVNVTTFARLADALEGSVRC